MILIQKCIEARFCLRSRIKKLFFSTPLWHFFDNPLCKNQKIRAIRSTRENIKKRHKNIEENLEALHQRPSWCRAFSVLKEEKKETLKKSTLGGNAVNKPPQAALREKLQKNLIKSMPEKNPVLYASLREKGRKKKVKIVQYPGRAGKGSFYKWVC